MSSLGQTFAAFHVFVIAFARLFQFSRLLQEAMGPEDLIFYHGFQREGGEFWKLTVCQTPEHQLNMVDYSF